MPENIAKTILDIEAEMFPVHKECYRRLEQIIETAEKNTSQEAEPSSILKGIGAAFEELGIEQAGKSNRLLSARLLEKKDNCKRSLLYHAIGEAIGLPIYVVNLPAHLFVRYDNGAAKVSWETSYNGECWDNVYVFIYNIHKDSIRKGAYMKNFSREEAIGLGTTMVAFELYSRRRLPEGLNYVNRAIELCPNDPIARVCKGNIHFALGNNEEALRSYDKAIELNPNEEAAYNNKGVVYKKLGKYPAARKCFKRGKKLEKELKSREACIAFACGRFEYKTGKRQAAAECFAEAVRLNKAFIAGIPVRCIFGVIKEMRKK